MRVLALIACAMMLAAAAPSADPPKLEGAPQAQQAAPDPKASGQEKPKASGVVATPQPEADPPPAKGKAENAVELGSWPDWVIVAFTAFLAWLSWRQHKLETRLAEDTGEGMTVAKESAAAAKASAAALEGSLSLLKAQLRAYVTVTDGHLTADHMTAPLVAHMVIANGGQTPARNLTVRIGIAQREFPLVGDLILQPPPTPASTQTLGPGVSMSIDIDMPRAPSREELQALRDGKAAIFVWGIIEYDDFTGERQRTDFRYFLGGDFGVRPGFILTAHEDGNHCT